MAACSDYGFGQPTSVAGGECFDRSYPGDDVDRDPTCYAVEGEGAIHNVITWHKENWSYEDQSDRVSMTPIVMPLTDDDIPDVIVTTYREDIGMLRALSGDDGSSLWDSDEVMLNPRSGLAGGDLDGDGDIEIIALTTDDRVACIDHQGTLVWVTEHDYSDHIGGEMDAPSIADMNADGYPEVIVGRLILDGDGTVLMEGNGGMGGPSGASASFAADLDSDGLQELVTGNTVYNLDGSVVFSNDEKDGYPAVADFTGDGEPEIVVSAEGEVRLQDLEGVVLWSTSLDGRSSGPPLLIDMDGEGVPEIAVASDEKYTVLDADGDILWSTDEITEMGGQTSASAFDFEGDGLPEVLYGDEKKLFIWTGYDGGYRLASNEHSSVTGMEYQLIVDVDNDEEAEIVSVSSANGDTLNGVVVFEPIDTEWPAARKIWNQHAYSVTNVNDDGTIPPVPEVNWRFYNSFRAAHMSVTSGLSRSDFFLEIADVCTQACADDMMSVWVLVGNQGLYSPTTDVDLTIYGVKEDGTYLEMETVQLSEGLPAGEILDAVRVDVYGHKGMDIVGLAAGIDGGNDASGGGTWAECDESNNEAEWPGSICQ